MEIDHGNFSREVELPADVEKDQISAQHRNGMLWIEYPRRTSQHFSCRHIAITASARNPQASKWLTNSLLKRQNWRRPSGRGGMDRISSFHE